MFMVSAQTEKTAGSTPIAPGYAQPSLSALPIVN
jgi:hypothetical protein